ncbi:MULTISPECIES: hypothetical protein [unclassified Sulfitobacter]|jgi:hypothetical protein|uniref:hypothetical protein n=1 Tax=unclassified Sulfitobacter TaxID=196795 RepID=UPI0037476CB5
MSEKQEQTGSGAESGSVAETRARVVAELKGASETIENGAFDLAGDASADVVSDLIRITADLQMLIGQLAQRNSR